MSRRPNPLGTLERLPKATRMWEAVYESAQERGFSEERSAQQAWGAVKRAGYHQDAEGVWHAPRDNNPPVASRFEKGDIVRFTRKFLRSTGIHTPPINGRVEGFSSLTTEKGEPFPVVLWSDAEETVPVHPGNLELDPRTRHATKGSRRRNYGIEDWPTAEVDSCIEGDYLESRDFDLDAAQDWEYTGELHAAQDKFTKEANRVVRAWIAAHPKAAESLEKSDDLDSDDDVAWNTWAAYVGHGVGFWEHMERADYEDLERAIKADDRLGKATHQVEQELHNMCAEAISAVRPVQRTGYFTNPDSNAAPTGISGPLRIESQRDGLWVVGVGLAVPVDTRGEGETLIDRLRRSPNPPDVTVVEFDSLDAMADALKVMDVALRPSRHERPTVFRLDWEDNAVVLEGHPDEPGVSNALTAIDYAGITFDAAVMPYAANPAAKGKKGSRARAAGYAFLGHAVGSVLGFGLGALIGGLAGGAIGGVPGALTGGTMAAITGTYWGGIGGAARGASMGAPKGQETEAAWGGGIGAAIPYVNFLTAPLGAYVATEDPAREKNLKRRLTER